jgi:signal peptidase I
MSEVHGRSTDVAVEHAPELVANRSGAPETRAAKTSAGHPVQTHGLLHSLEWLLCILVVVLFVITFTVQPFRIPSDSMEPTLMVGDFLLLAKQDFPALRSVPIFHAAAIKRGDVVVFHYPLDPSVYLVKRVIGMPGDHLKLRNNRVFIDGHPLQESYAVYKPEPPDSFRDSFPRLQSPDPSVDSNWWILMKSLVNRGELTVPPGQYFVLGDNRNDSEDSRYWGFVPAAAIVGRPLLIYFSLNQEVRDDESLASSGSAAKTRLGTPRKDSRWAALAHFARWDRTFRVVH